MIPVVAVGVAVLVAVGVILGVAVRVGAAVLVGVCVAVGDEVRVAAGSAAVVPGGGSEGGAGRTTTVAVSVACGGNTLTVAATVACGSGAEETPELLLNASTNRRTTIKTVEIFCIVAFDLSDRCVYELSSAAMLARSWASTFFCFSSIPISA